MCPRCRAARRADLGSCCVEDGAFLVDRGALARSDGNPLLGARVLGRFGLLDAARFGARATVYRAIDVVRGDVCAVKVLRAEDDPAGELGREAFILERVDGAHAPAPRGHGAIPIVAMGAAGLAMDWARGIALDVLGGTTGDIARCCELGRAIALALADVHERGVIHGDLKPSHVFVDDSEITFVDFGAAALGAEAGARAVTPAYAAPELARAGRLTPSADVYALGCLLLFLITGRSTSPTPPERPSSIPIGLERAIEACLAPQAAQRPSARELATLLDSA